MLSHFIRISLKGVKYSAIFFLLFTSLSSAADRLVYETFEDQQWNDSFEGTFNSDNVDIVPFTSARSGNYVARMYGGYLGGAFDYRINAVNNTEFYVKYYQYFPQTNWNWSNISRTGLKQIRAGAGQGDGWPIQTFKSDGIDPHTHGYYSEGDDPSGIRDRIFFANGEFPSLGTWHKVEVYLKYSDTEGGYWWKMDDVLIAGSESFEYDVWPPPFGNVIGILRFAGGNGFPSGDFYYIDDVEIWNGLPNVDSEPDAVPSVTGLGFLAITYPTNTGTYNSSTSTVNLSGVVQGLGLYTVAWVNSRGGSGTGIVPFSGTWAVENIPLASGTNTITITATDSSNRERFSVIVINY